MYFFMDGAFSILLYGWGFFENKPLQMASLWKVDHTLGTDLENDPLPKMPYHENETVQPLRAYLDAAVVQVSKAVRNSRH